MLEMSGKELFPNLFKPGKIGVFKTPNRIKYAACSVSNYNSPQGFILEREHHRDEVIGKTGAGVLTNQGAYPDPKGEGKAYWRQVALYDERFVPGFLRVSEMWRRDNPDALIIQQILHAGRYGGYDLDYSILPSYVPQKIFHFGKPPKVATIEDIDRIIAEHVRCAKLCIQAGFDGIEITSFQGYLIANWNSRYTNKRTDEYGGSVEKRSRFMVELIQALRKAIGPNLVLGARLPSTELLGDEGNSGEECLEVAKIAQDAGVDYISITMGWHESPQGALGRMYQADQWLPTIKDWKKHLKVPLAFGVGCYDPFVAEEAVKSGLMDYWELCRPMLADPERIHMIARNDLDAIRPCIGCLMCLAKGLLNQPYVCTVNPVLGHEGEDEYKPQPAKRKKSVMIIGGGPAGIQTALAAREKGHHVSIYDAKETLGGQLLSCAKDQHGGDRYQMLIDYYEEKLRRTDIEVHLGIYVAPKLIREIHPDVIVLATGSKFERLKIPGIERENVYDVFDIMEREIAPQGDRITVMHGGKVGLVAAFYLATIGKKVTLIHEGKDVYEKVPATFRWRYKAWLKEYKVEAITESRLASISDRGLTILDADGKESIVNTDAVILAKRVSNQELFDFIELNSDECCMVGDAISPGHLITAIHGGHRLGCRI